jgi:hypothetical protein
VTAHAKQIGQNERLPAAQCGGFGDTPSSEGRAPLVPGFGTVGLATVVVIASLLTLAPPAPAQQQQQLAPRIGYVFPAGGRQGTTLEVTVGGRALDGITDVRVTGAGIRVTVGEHVKPINAGMAGNLRDKLKELRDKPAKDAAIMKEIAEIVKKLAIFASRRNNPALAETVTLQVTIAADAPPGQREMRLVTPNAVTNPMVFCVGQIPEFAKHLPKPGEGKPLRELRRANQQPGAAPPFEMNITIPATVNGQILPGGVDRYRFQAVQGQHLTVVASARGLIPYLADAVPGWFQAVVALYDEAGNEVAYADSFRFNPDPAFYIDIPKTGQYVLQVRDSIYRGREDFVYRVAVGELPFVTSIFPLGGKVGEQTAVELRGWNLPIKSTTQDAAGKAPGTYPLSLKEGICLSNPVPFAVDSLPECLRKDPPAGAAQAPQAVTPPIIVNGRIAKPGQWDVFRFDGRAGQEIVAEVYARRLGSALDSILKLTDSSGKLVAANDDHEDKGTGLNTHHADSYLRVKLPADGAYLLYLGDVQNQGGPECGYRLRLSPPQPDFELRAAPSSVNVRANATVAMTVFALRKDGFAGEIGLHLKDAPAGFVLDGGLIPAGQDQVRVTLTAPAPAPPGPLNLAIEGRGRIDGRQVARTAVPAEDMMQAFAYRHLVCCQEMDVMVGGRFGQRGAVRLLGATPLRIPAGKTARIRVGVPASTPMGELALELDQPPEGITIKDTSSALGSTEIVFQADAAKAKCGLKGNLIVNLILIRAARGPAAAPPAGKPTTKPAAGAASAPAPPALRRIPAGVLPAIPFEIVAP